MLVAVHVQEVADGVQPRVVVRQLGAARRQELGVLVRKDAKDNKADRGGDTERTIDLTVVIIIDGLSTTIDDDLDDWAEALEAVLKDVPPARNMQLVATALDVQSDEAGDLWFGYLALDYQATAFTD